MIQLRVSKQQDSSEKVYNYSLFSNIPEASFTTDCLFKNFKENRSVPMSLIWNHKIVPFFGLNDLTLAYSYLVMNARVSSNGFLNVASFYSQLIW